MNIQVVGFAAFALAACAACGAEPDGIRKDEGPCAQRAGSYIMSFSERSGTCGKGSEIVVNITAQPTAVTAPCTGSISYSPDNCEVTYSSRCPNDGVVKGGTLAITGKSRWSADGSTGTAVETWSLIGPDGSSECLSTYDVSATRQ